MHAQLKRTPTVSYKRFADMAPLAVGHELLHGLDAGVEKVVFDGLGLGGGHSLQRAQDLLQEPVNVVAKRDQLWKKTRSIGCRSIISSSSHDPV
jgi:hypothetical protein